ncbi:NUDIX hydrolase [Sandarakinorhabdus oryzae]|uniref:NUDIX hydrolase n=1 Tax=Sandarakinorhabdus oryzae TaxID=2675220 RepID=UPI0018CBFA4B|nr:NUDIX hydrolase [Sandarakinorhabdus oryzae]
MTETAKPVAIPAATVILAREGPGGVPEFLLVQRGENLAFAGGALVFPGGRVDAADIHIARNELLAFGFEGLDDIDAAARITCAREALEETGVLLTDGPHPDEAALAKARAVMASGPDEAESVGFAGLLGAMGHRVEAARFIPFARWEPPAAAAIARRFDTRFYLADAGRSASAAITPDGFEAQALRWTTAAQALADYDAGQAAMVFPTWCNMHRLAQYQTLASLFERVSALPAPYVQPAFEMVEGEAWLTIPEGIDYPVTRDRVNNLRRE